MKFQRLISFTLIYLVLFVILVSNIVIAEIDSSTENIILSEQNVLNETISPIIKNNLTDLGTITENDDGSYLYRGDNYSFSFIPFKLVGYAQTYNSLMLYTSDESVLFAAINMEEDSLRYVVKRNNIICIFDVFNLGLNYHLVDSQPCLDDSLCFHELSLETNEQLYMNLVHSLTWFVKYSPQNENMAFVEEISTISVQTHRSVDSATDITFTGKTQAVNAAIMTVGIYFSDNHLKNPGCYFGEVRNTDGEIAGAYVVENYYDQLDNEYVSRVAVWDFHYDVIKSLNGTCLEAIGSITKKYNLFFQYSEGTNTAKVIQAPDDSTYIITRNFDTMFRLYGSYNFAYIGEYGFYLYRGGSPATPDSLVSLTASNILSFLGQRYLAHEFDNSLYVYIRTALEQLEYYSYSQAKEAYEITNNSSVGYARTVASTYNSLLYERYSTCEARALIYNYPDRFGSMYFQTEFDINCGFAGNPIHHVRLIQRKSVVYS